METNWAITILSILYFISSTGSASSWNLHKTSIWYLTKSSGYECENQLTTVKQVNKYNLLVISKVLVTCVIIVIWFAVWFSRFYILWVWGIYNGQPLATFPRLLPSLSGSKSPQDRRCFIPGFKYLLCFAIHYSRGNERFWCETWWRSNTKRPTWILKGQTWEYQKNVLYMSTLHISRGNDVHYRAFFFRGYFLCLFPLIFVVFGFYSPW